MPVIGSKVTVGTTPTDILGTLSVPENSTVFITNNSAVSIFLGGPTVTASGGSQGFELKAGQSMPNPLEVSQQTHVYAIVAAATQLLDVLAITPY